jgi:hypothetical protein
MPNNDSKFFMALATRVRQCSKYYANIYHDYSLAYSSRFWIHNHFVFINMQLLKNAYKSWKKETLNTYLNSKDCDEHNRRGCISSSWNINSVLTEMASVIQRHFLWPQTSHSAVKEGPLVVWTWGKVLGESRMRNELIHDHYSRLENF